MEASFIGLGMMGRAMAANLVRAGHRVRVCNRSRAPVDELARAGAEPVAEVRAAFRDVVFSMLADDAAVRAVVLESGALDTAPAGTVHVNGDPAALDRVQPLLDAIGQRTWRVGDEPKQANAVKLAGNFMIAAAIESMAEAAVLAERHGVSPEELLRILTGTLFAAPVYQNYGAMVAERRYDPASFRLTLGLKDVHLALDAAESARIPMPFASVLRDNLLDAVARGDGDRDWAALAEVARQRAGLS